MPSDPTATPQTGGQDRITTIAARSVQQVIDAGMPFVVDSGITAKVYHQGGCSHWHSLCTCGVDAQLNRLAIEFSDALDKFGRP